MSATKRVEVRHSFTSSPEVVFDALSEHENLGPLFGVKVTRRSDGQASRNGVGSSRSMRLAPFLPAFVETTTLVERPTLIEYRITQGLVPLTGHHGVQRLAARPSGGTDLLYTIAFESPIPGVAQIVGVMLTRTIRKALPTLVP